MIKLLEIIKDILFIFSVPLFIVVFLAIVDFKYESLKRDCELTGGHVVLSERGNYKECVNVKEN